MVSIYEMFAAVVDLVVGAFEWITWPFIVVSWPFRVALTSIFVWWSYLTKVIVYGVLHTIFWPFQVVAAARREKETRSQLLLVQHQLLQATAIAKDLTMKYEVAVEERTHARDALETCVEEKKRLKNKFHQAQLMLRKMDTERRRAWELAGEQPKEAARPEALEHAPSSEGLVMDNVNTDRHPPLSPERPLSDPASDLDAHRLFLNAELENGLSEASAHDAGDLSTLNQRSKRARKDSAEGGSLPKASELPNGRESLGGGTRRESLGSGSRRESLGTGTRRDSLGPGPRRESNVSATNRDEEGAENEDGGAGVVSTVVQCGLIGWTLVVLGASTAAILGLFIIMILPALVGKGNDTTTQRVAEYVTSVKWFVLGFVFCYYMETEEFSWFKQGLEAVPHVEGLVGPASQALIGS